MKKLILVVLFVALGFFSLNKPLAVAETSTHYKKAIVYYKEAQSYKNMGKALPLYNKAIKEAQWAIVNLEDPKQELMQGIIEDSREKIRVFEEMVMLAKQERELVLGMSKKDVKALWGTPKDISNSVTEYGNREQWSYKDTTTKKNKYVYFEDDVVVSWRD